VQHIVFEAHYLVMGLGDVYLGASVATLLHPRHRLVTTKYNPARTWTAENSVDWSMMFTMSSPVVPSAITSAFDACAVRISAGSCMPSGCSGGLPSPMGKRNSDDRTVL